MLDNCLLLCDYVNLKFVVGTLLSFTCVMVRNAHDGQYLKNFVFGASLIFSQRTKGSVLVLIIVNTMRC